ncbi:MAG: TOBE domain-containing protein, partial [Desulfobacterium sp.]
KNKILGILEDVFFQGSVMRIRIKTLFGCRFSFDVPARGRLPEKGETVEIAIDPESIRVING